MQLFDHTIVNAVAVAYSNCKFYTSDWHRDPSAACHPHLYTHTSLDYSLSRQLSAQASFGNSRMTSCCESDTKWISCWKHHSYRTVMSCLYKNSSSARESSKIQVSIKKHKMQVGSFAEVSFGLDDPNKVSLMSNLITRAQALRIWENHMLYVLWRHSRKAWVEQSITAT